MPFERGLTSRQISMFWFGWTSAGSIHWISPVIASALWAASAFLLFQAGLKYASSLTVINMRHELTCHAVTAILSIVIRDTRPPSSQGTTSSAPCSALRSRSSAQVRYVIRESRERLLTTRQPSSTTSESDRPVACSAEFRSRCCPSHSCSINTALVYGR